jgi:superfamily II DNA or RNA helicase
VGRDRRALAERVRQARVTYAVGSLVRARGREWVVLPESEDELLVLRPLGGSDDEIAGILPTLEQVEQATFSLPEAEEVGDHRSAGLLRDALRLGFRSSAGPFRSFGHIAVEPRPYQLVPLLMALKLDPVRLLIADDVGIGKTVEALLVARELLEQGDAQRLTVLCPPHLAEQWQGEMRDKFHLDAELVLTSTVPKLERGLGIGESLFERHPLTVVSTDFIKADRRRLEFLRAAPELVIVDEAHTCADPSGGRARHQRYQLVSGLAEDRDRHIILVTATPHSGKEEPFRALIGFLDPSFADLPEDLTTEERRSERERLARHFVQRRRADIRSYLDAETVFPDREALETSYTLSPEYKRFFERVLAYARESVADPSGGQHRQRVRWWSALALLRALASSPAAAAETLRTRAQSADTDTPDEADEVGRRAVLDLADDESAEGMDVVPGADTVEDNGARPHRRLLELAREADKLRDDSDNKLIRARALIKGLIDDGYNPIVFCRFIATAEYVAEALRGKVGKDVEVVAVTGKVPASDRESRVEQLGKAPRRVLVATDCLSEGVNLQDHFDAVFHYDLSWNPTRHEQREGRVDRYGQPRDTVRALMYYGRDNQIDGIVLDVLLRKHRAIRDRLGVSVPVPVDSNAVLESILEGLLLRNREEQLRLFEKEVLAPKRDDLHGEWDTVADREKRSRTVFAQASIKVDDVAREVTATRDAIGSGVDVERFAAEALEAHGALVRSGDPLELDLREVPIALRDLLGTANDEVRARFELPIKEDETYLSRTHPLVEGLASYVLDTALDPHLEGVARRAGVIRTRAVARRTTVLILRFRHDVVRRTRDGERRLLAEEAGVVAFARAPDSAEWLDSDTAHALLSASPDANIAPEQASDAVRSILDGYDELIPALEAEAKRRADALLEAHRRVRVTGERYRVEPRLPADVLGVYVYLPVVA